MMQNGKKPPLPLDLILSSGTENFGRISQEEPKWKARLKAPALIINTS